MLEKEARNSLWKNIINCWRRDDNHATWRKEIVGALKVRERQAERSNPKGSCGWKLSELASEGTCSQSFPESIYKSTNKGPNFSNKYSIFV